VTDYGSIFGKCHDGCISRAALFAYVFSGSCDGFAKCMSEIFVAIGPVTSAIATSVLAMIATQEDDVLA